MNFHFRQKTSIWSCPSSRASITCTKLFIWCGFPLPAFARTGFAGMTTFMVCELIRLYTNISHFVCASDLICYKDRITAKRLDNIAEGSPTCTCRGTLGFENISNQTLKGFHKPRPRDFMTNLLNPYRVHLWVDLFNPGFVRRRTLGCVV